MHGPPRHNKAKVNETLQCTRKPCLTRPIIIDSNASWDTKNDNKTPNRLAQLFIFVSGYPRFSYALREVSANTRNSSVSVESHITSFTPSHAPGLSKDPPRKWSKAKVKRMDRSHQKITPKESYMPPKSSLLSLSYSTVPPTQKKPAEMHKSSQASPQVYGLSERPTYPKPSYALYSFEFFDVLLHIVPKTLRFFENIREKKN